MGGRVLDLPSDKLREEFARGVNEGISQGLSQGVDCEPREILKKNH